MVFLLLRWIRKPIVLLIKMGYDSEQDGTLKQTIKKESVVCLFETSCEDTSVTFFRRRCCGGCAGSSFFSAFLSVFMAGD